MSVQSNASRIPEQNQGTGLERDESLRSSQSDSIYLSNDIGRVLAQCYRLAALRGREIRQAHQSTTNAATPPKEQNNDHPR